jgi:hypothetical protein
VIIRVATGAPDPSPKLRCRRPKHEVAGRAVVKGEVAAAAHSVGVSRGGDNAFASITAKNGSRNGRGGVEVRTAFEMSTARDCPPLFAPVAAVR